MYKLRTDYFDADFEPDRWGWYHEDELPAYDVCREQVESLVQAVYETGDVEQMRNAIEELVGQLDMDEPSVLQTPKIQNTTTEIQNADAK